MKNSFQPIAVLAHFRHKINSYGRVLLNYSYDFIVMISLV